MGCLQLPSLADEDLQMQIFPTATCRQACVTLPWMEERCEAGTQARASADTSVRGPSCAMGWEEDRIPYLPLSFPMGNGKKRESPGGRTKALSTFFAEKQWNNGKQLRGGAGREGKGGEWFESNSTTSQQYSHSQRVSTAKKHRMSREATKPCLSHPGSLGLRENCMKGISLRAEWEMCFIASKEKWDSCLAKWSKSQAGSLLRHLHLLCIAFPQQDWGNFGKTWQRHQSLGRSHCYCLKQGAHRETSACPRQLENLWWHRDSPPCVSLHQLAGGRHG